MASEKTILLLALGLFCSSLGYGQGKVPGARYKDTIPVKYDSLHAAVVTASLRPKMKGDTVEFSTGRMQMRHNAVVQDLLQRLPGLRVSANGTVTYNGETIEHLFIDGEDVFGNNPALVLRNFDANKIAFVQVLDRKTDQAQFSGVDDGTRIKAINLVVKESEKNGYSGRLEAGANAEGNYGASGVLAGFRGKEQFSAIGLSANTGELNFDANGAGVPANSVVVSGAVDPLGASAGAGIPQLAGGGLHYSNQWDGQVHHAMANYQFGHLLTNPVTSIHSIQIQPGGIFDQRQQNQSVNKDDQHAFDGRYDFKMDPRSDLRLSFAGLFGQSQNQLQATTRSLFDNFQVNDGLRTIRDFTTNRNASANAFWKIALGNRQDQVLSCNAGLTKEMSEASGYLYSYDRFLQPDGTFLNADTVNQRKQVLDQSVDVHAGIAYVQPISHGVSFGVAYKATFQTGKVTNETYGIGGGKYDELVDSLSSELMTQSTSQVADVNLQGKARRLSYSFGASWNRYFYSQQPLRGGSELRLDNGSVLPRLFFDYMLRKDVEIRLIYQSSVQQPSIAQLAPTTNNTNPLSLFVGNPDLRPARQQFITLSCKWIKPWMVYSAFNLRINSNNISSRLITDSLGRQISEPVNAGTAGTAGVDVYVTHRMADINWGFRTNASYSKFNSYVGAGFNSSGVFSTGAGVSANKYLSEKYSFQLDADIRYVSSRNSVNTVVPVNYWTQSHSLTLNVYLIRHFEFGTSAIYNWQQRTNLFSESTSKILWNAFIARSFIHESISVKIHANNILDQNAGISRVNDGVTNTQTATNIIGRYWMLSVMYHFDRKFKKK